MIEVTSSQNEIIDEWNKNSQVSGLTEAPTVNRLESFQKHM